jgi:hypothetical protein
MTRILRIAPALLCVHATLAQTLIDLKTQARHIDFGDAVSTRPAKTGSALPGVCSTGDVFFLTSAPAGANLWGCAATNTWVSQSGTTAGEASSGDSPHLHARTDLADCRVVRNSSTVLDIPACRIVRSNTDPIDVTNASITYNSGSGILYVFGTAAGVVGVLHTGTLDVSCTGCTDYGPATGFPEGAQRLWEWPVTTSGAWDMAGTDRRMPVVPHMVTPGMGLLTSGTAAGQEFTIDTAVVPTLGGEQAGQSLLCNGSASSTAQTCGMTPALTAYTTGMRIHWRSGALIESGLTLNVDNLGPKPVRLSDGSTSPVAFSIAGGEYRTLVYDGSVFRILNGGAGSQIIAATPVSALAPNALAYCTPLGASCSGAVSGSQEIRWPVRGIVSEVTAVTASAQTGGNLVCSAFVNGSASAASVTVPAGTSAGSFTGSGIAAFAPGDRLALHCVNGSSNSSASVVSVSARITY